MLHELKREDKIVVGSWMLQFLQVVFEESAKRIFSAVIPRNYHGGKNYQNQRPEASCLVLKDKGIDQESIRSTKSHGRTRNNTNRNVPFSGAFVLLRVMWIVGALQAHR